MRNWKKNVTTYNKCNAKCTVKVLVADKDEVKNEKPAAKSRGVRKSKTTA